MRGGVLATPALCAIAVLCTLATPAYGLHVTRWVVSGTLTGTYTNHVAWLNCPESGASGTAQESLRLAARISPGQPGVYEGTGIAVAMKMTPGGSWSVTGSYPPHVELADGTSGCGPQQSFHCGGPIVRGGGPGAVLYFAPRGRSLAGNFLENTFLKETNGEACEIEATIAGPLLGLADTRIEPDAFAEDDAKPTSIMVPRARFAGSKAFTVTHAAPPDGGCPREFYTQCSETGSVTLTLHFKRAR